MESAPDDDWFCSDCSDVGLSPDAAERSTSLSMQITAPPVSAY